MRLLTLIAFLALAASGHGATWNTDSTPQPGEIAAILANPSFTDGDTIQLPACDETWTTNLTYSRPCTLAGSGIGVTIIHEDMPGTASSADSMLNIDTSGSSLFRVTGIEFRAGVITTNRTKGVVVPGGNGTSFRLDHCRFYRLKNANVKTRGYVRGVIDHNEFVTNNANQFITVFHDTWAGNSLGDASWSEPVDWDSMEFLFIEDNAFTGEGSTIAGAIDTYGGSRIVLRHNTLNNASFPTHGTRDGSGRNRGARAYIVHDNPTTASPATSKNWFHVRGGTGIVCDNPLTGFTKGVTLHEYGFDSNHGKFGEADGTCPWDINDTSDGAGTPGGAGDGVFWDGTCASGTTENLLVVSGSPWIAGQLVGYTVRIPVTTGVPQGFFSAVIRSNTTNSLTVEPGSQWSTLSQSGNANDAKKFQVGDAFEIRRVLLPLGCIGAGPTDLLTDKAVNPTPVDLHAQREPMYLWNNTVAPSSQPGINSGYHYAAPSVGLLANRPASPAEDFDAYFATDAGTQGILYRGIGGSWTVMWDKGAQTYPHPLAGGSPPPPNPPAVPSALFIGTD